METQSLVTNSNSYFRTQKGSQVRSSSSSSVFLQRLGNAAPLRPYNAVPSASPQKGVCEDDMSACKYENSSCKVRLRKTSKCYILTDNSKIVHFDIDEDGHHEISTKDSQSHEDIAWLSVFTRNEAPDSKILVSLTQRSKLNEFVFLCKSKKNLSLKVLKASCSEPDCPSFKGCDMKTCSHENPDFKQLSEENNLFIMHNQGTSVQFQCYEDRSYYLCVNDDSLDIRKLENKEPNEEKNFYFRVSYLEEK